MIKIPGLMSAVFVALCARLWRVHLGLPRTDVRGPLLAIDPARP